MEADSRRAGAPPDLSHPDLEHERAYLARARACLAAMRAATEAALAGAEAATEVDAAVARAHLAQRLRTLDPGAPNLAFGRLDAEAATTQARPGDRWYVGRRHVEDDRGEAVVVDWRAPVAVPFYRATPADALGLARRRRFILDGADLVDLLDEVFDDPDSVDAAHHGGIPDPLLAELERTRTGTMRDIVATIAAEQDEVIRAELATCVLVQGGPGTGKTAVGLHRAAFLLYEHRDRLDRDGVLVVGPNPVFLRYISQVLPSLGEHAVRQATLATLVGGPIGAVDPPERERLLGDVRLAEVTRRALQQLLRPPTDPLVVTLPWGRVRLDPDTVAGAMADIAGRPVAFATGRGSLRTRLARAAWQQLVDSRGDGFATASDVESALAAAPTFTAALGRWWPTVSGPSLARRVLTNRAALGRAADGLLSRDEIDLVRRPPAPKVGDEAWSAAERVLVDEAEALVNGVRRTYGHLVVDEAQDLSALGLRALARRCPSGSLTVLGDLAQATAPAAQASWQDTAAHLGVALDDEQASLVTLDLGYRVPAPIMALADRLLPLAAPHVPPTRSVREAGRQPEVRSAGAGEVAARAAEAVTDLTTRWGSLGVICPPAHTEELLDALAARGTPAATGPKAVGWTGEAGEAPVAVVTPVEAKGLEFDGVVVVEPADFLTGPDDQRGARLLYVALTRAVQELVVVHERRLPTPLQD